MTTRGFPAPAVLTDVSRFRALRILLLAAAVAISAVGGIFVVEFGRPSYIIIGLVSLLAFLASIFSVELGLLILAFLVYTRFSDIVVHNYDGPSVAKFFIALLALAILIRWVIFHDPARGWQRPSIFIAIYFMVSFGSLLYAIDPGRVTSALVVLIKDAIIAVIVVVLLQNMAAFRRVVWVLLTAGIFLGSLSVYQYATGTFANDYGGFATARIQQIVGEVNDYRVGGPIGDPNAYAQVMVVLVPIALERFFHEPTKRRKLLALWSFTVSAFTVVITYSRGGFLALAAAMGLYFIFFPPRLRHAPLIILAALTLALFIPQNYYARMLSLNQLFQTPGTFRTEDPALRSRALEMATAWEMFKEHPFLGVGLSNYSLGFREYSRRFGISIGGYEFAAHDLYFEVMSETGMLGLAAFLAMIMAGLRSVWDARKRFLKARLPHYASMATAFGIGVVGYLTAAMFIHGPYPRYFYLLLGISYSLELASRNTILSEAAGFKGNS